MNKYDAFEQAYKNGFEEALDKKELMKAICIGIQKTELFCDEKYCRMRVKEAECCDFCRVLAEEIQKARGLR